MKKLAGPIFLSWVLWLAGCVSPNGAAPVRQFNVSAFTGLVAVQGDDYTHAVLSCDLDGANGQNIHVTNYLQAEQIQEADVRPSEIPLLRLLRVNCLALKEFEQSRPAKQSFFPRTVTEELIMSLPAAAVPKLNDEDMRNRQNTTLAAFEKALKVVIKDGNSAAASSDGDEWDYTIMARGDFDGDGVEDLLMRVDWRALDASGQGTDLLLVSKTSPAAPIKLIWRPSNIASVRHRRQYMIERGTRMDDMITSIMLPEYGQASNFVLRRRLNDCAGGQMRQMFKTIFDGPLVLTGVQTL